ncbi:MAG TPA: hypothetical protein VJ729_11715 [Nitrososphaeraceae archaeon]|nr:hypothetical protein [Nitrososphaeraceae archaeon]
MAQSSSSFVVTGLPIIFEANEKNQQHVYNEKNNQVILIVPKEIQIRPGRL